MLKNIFILGLAITGQPRAVQIPASEQAFRLSVTADLVLLDVSARDSAGEHVSNLGKDSFRVYEDGKLQQITQFSANDVPVTVGLVIDTSGSMRPKYDVVVSAAMEFIQASNRKDEMFIANFGDRVTRGLPPDIPFTADIGLLRSSLSWKVPAGRTALYDAVLFALQHLETGKCEKKALLLVSDGGDNSSTHHSEEVLRTVRESHATIYAIGIFDAGDADRNPALLRRLAQMSGGEAFLPEDLSAVGGICRQIARDIRTRYSIGYTPVRSGDRSSLRRVRVTASTPDGRKLVVHTRTSYVLPPARPLIDEIGDPGRNRGL